MEGAIGDIADGRSRIKEDDIEGVSKAIHELAQAAIEMAEMVPIPSTVAQAKRLKSIIEGGFIAKDIHSALKELQNRLEDELEAHRFIYVRSEHLSYYAGEQLFGDEVDSCFPKAIDDIADAGRCIALGMGTASAFHSMRVMEVGLRALANALDIPYAPSWESYIRQINTSIEAKHRTKNDQWKKDEPFFRDVSGDLTSIKIAWRNPTMHIVKRYSPEEAEEIFRAARTFMKRLASHLDESGKRVE